MAWKLTVDGVDVTGYVHRQDLVSFTQQLNERATAQVTFVPGYVPTRFKEAVFYDIDGTTPLFGGVVLNRGDVRGVPEPVDRKFITPTRFSDFNFWLDGVFVTEAYAAAPTLKEVLEDLLADFLAAYDFTLDPGQIENGPVLLTGNWSWTDVRATDALRDLGMRSGTVFRVSPTKVLRMLVPGTDSAPYAMTDASPHTTGLSWRDSEKIPADTVVLSCGPTAAQAATQYWVADGIATSWVTDIAATDAAVGLLDLQHGSDPVEHCTVGPGAMFEWDYGTHTITLGTHALPAAGDTLTFIYTAQYPFEVTASGAGTLDYPLEYRASYPDILEVSPGQATANGLLEQLNRQPREITAPSLDRGWEEGQLLTVDMPVTRAIACSALINNVRTELNAEGAWVRTVQATETDAVDTLYSGSALDDWRALLSNGISGGIVISGGGGSGGGGTLLTSPFPLGGSRVVSMLAPTLTPVLNYFDFIAGASFTGLVRCDLWARNGGIGVKAELWAVDGTPVMAGDSTTVISQSPVYTPFTVTIVSGRTYRLLLLSGTPTEAVYGIGTLYA